MGYLHESKMMFASAVRQASLQFHVTQTIVEKDYYVTMILKELSSKLPFVVFKGGTSLSKCHKVIQRFSEDIDITIDSSISQGQKKKLKKTIREIADTLGLEIPNIDETRSRRDYNRYILEYESVVGEPYNLIVSPVLVETSFTEVSFPTVILPIHSYIGDVLQGELPDALEEWHLLPFEMKVQGIDRTLADKVFAICDYYLQGRVMKHSRHIYDIYKLLPLVPQTDAFKALVREVRVARAKTSICPAAQPGVNVPDILRLLIDSDIYKEDYETITSQILDEIVPYETAIEAVRVIAGSGIFDE